MEQGSYLLLEPGMPVRNDEGTDLGTVVKVAADENADIFRGFVLSASSWSRHDRVFVPADRLVSVVGEVATVHLTAAERDQLEPADGVAALS